jgi:regulator of protease activity HflC (stomatin/prohibitin superfamily)
MLFIILAVVLALVILGGLITGVFSEYSRGAGFGTAAAGVVLLLILTGFFSATTVGARNVGIQTEFGKYKSTLDSGFQWTSPTSSVEEFSTQIQPLKIGAPISYAGQEVPSTDGKTPVSADATGGGKGTATATVRWFIDKDAAENLWKKYRSFDRVRDNLVLSTAQESLRVVVGTYTPQAAIAGSNLREITQKIEADLRSTLGDDGIKIDSVSVTGIALDSKTQDSLQKTVSANQDIATALAREQRSIIDGRTVANQKSSGALEGDALVRYCLDVVNNWNVKRNGNLPAGFSCVGSASDFVVTGK